MGYLDTGDSTLRTDSVVSWGTFTHPFSVQMLEAIMVLSGIVLGLACSQTRR